MQTYEQFRAAAARLQAYRVDSHIRRPALIFQAAGGAAAAHPRRPLARAARTPPAAEREGALTMGQAARLVAGGSASAVELVRQAYRAVDRWNSHVNAFEYVRPESDALRE